MKKANLKANKNNLSFFSPKLRKWTCLSLCHRTAWNPNPVFLFQSPLWLSRLLLQSLSQYMPADVFRQVFQVGFINRALCPVLVSSSAVLCAVISSCVLPVPNVQWCSWDALLISWVSATLVIAPQALTGWSAPVYATFSFFFLQSWLIIKSFSLPEVNVLKCRLNLW